MACQVLGYMPAKSRMIYRYTLTLYGKYYYEREREEYLLTVFFQSFF